MTPTLYALIVRLVAENGGDLRATQGRLAHAAFLALLRGVDPPLAARLHDDDGPKPFTVSPLLGLGHGRNGRLSVCPGDTPWLRVTLLDPLLFHAFIAYFLRPANRPRLRLEPIGFQVTELISTPGGHPLAGYASLADLRARWEAVDAARHRRIVLEFRSPTVFHLKDGKNEADDDEAEDESPPGSRKPPRRMHVLPDPALVFGELAGRWDRLSGEATQAATRDEAARYVVVARHDIETHMVDFGGGRKQVGFTGRVAFEVLDKDNEPLIRRLNRLADLAFYTGVGSKTTMGMGQVSRI